MEEKKAVADNMECANALEAYKQGFLDPLKAKMGKAHFILLKAERILLHNRFSPNGKYF